MTSLDRLEQLADKLDVTPTTVALWEEGGPLPDEALDRCCELFGLSGAYLMGEDG